MTNEPCCRNEFFPSPLLIMSWEKCCSLQTAIAVILTTESSLPGQTDRTKHLFLIFSLLSPNEDPPSTGKRQEEKTQPKKKTDKETQAHPTVITRWERKWRLIHSDPGRKQVWEKKYRIDYIYQQHREPQVLKTSWRLHRQSSPYSRDIKGQGEQWIYDF